jgi:hypothetical protein
MSQEVIVSSKFIGSLVVMKNLVRIAVAGVLMTGFATAQAQNLPSTGNSDLWVFVSNQAAGTTFAEDTGISLSSLVPTAQLSANSVLSTAITANFSLAASSALTSYISSANSAGQPLEWAVDGIQYPGTTAGTGYRKAGGILAVTDNVASQESNTAQLTLGNLQAIGQGIQGDMIYQLQSYTAGGSVYKFSNGSLGGNVWGAASGNNGGSTDLYGQGPDQAGVALGSETVLYGLTGNGGTGQVQSYILGTNLTLTANGTLQVGGTTPPPVPLPAAVWLFGSGLLGLVGVGRRRSAAAA